jgi:hypothetical protein
MGCTIATLLVGLMIGANRIVGADSEVLQSVFENRSEPRGSRNKAA